MAAITTTDLNAEKALRDFASRPVSEKATDAALDRFIADRLAHYSRFNVLTTSEIQRLVIQDVRSQF